MSRTTRRKLEWNYNTATLNTHARDNKGRCDCCGNTEQKRQNKRDRANARRNPTD